jgi:hypothetical protein
MKKPEGENLVSDSLYVRNEGTIYTLLHAVTLISATRTVPLTQFVHIAKLNFLLSFLRHQNFPAV